MDYLSQQQVNIEAVAFSNVVILPNKVAGDAFFEMLYEMSIDVVVYTCDGYYPVVTKFKEKVDKMLESRTDLNIVVFGAKYILDKKIDGLLDLMKLLKWKKSKVKTYSKGMMQRLGLAQAMINDPDLIFLDEPTDGVDPIGRKEIRAILLELKKAGMLDSKKGKGGGYFLNIPASKIPLADIIRKIDGPMSMLPCTSLYFYERCKNCDEKNCTPSFNAGHFVWLCRIAFRFQAIIGEWRHVSTPRGSSSCGHVQRFTGSNLEASCFNLQGVV